MHQKSVFDVSLGDKLKEKGIDRACNNYARKEALEKAKEISIELGKRQSRVSIDDVYVEMEHRGIDFSSLGNCAGSIFRNKHWLFTMNWEPSIRTSNHRRMNRVWTYIGE
jgi:hypothetical protein